MFLLQRYWVGRRTYVTVTGKVGQRSRDPQLAPWAARAFWLGCLFVAAVIVYFYVLLLYASLVVAFGANHAFTWSHYQVIFTEGLTAIRDTLIIAAIGMPLGGLYGVLVGYLIARKRFPGRRAMELVAMINYALPGTIVGIAYLIAFNDPPIALTGTALIIVACYVFRYSPTGIRATGGAAAADRPQHRGGLVQPGRRQRRDLPPRHPAADRARPSSPASASSSSAP